jgi:hypothetical protein
MNNRSGPVACNLNGGVTHFWSEKLLREPNRFLGNRMSTLELLYTLRNRATLNCPNTKQPGKDSCHDSEKPWMSEDYRMSIFDAVALALIIVSF